MRIEADRFPSSIDSDLPAKVGLSVCVGSRDRIGKWVPMRGGRCVSGYQTHLFVSMSRNGTVHWFLIFGVQEAATCVYSTEAAFLPTVHLQDLARGYSYKTPSKPHWRAPFPVLSCNHTAGHPQEPHTHPHWRATLFLCPLHLVFFKERGSCGPHAYPHRFLIFGVQEASTYVSSTEAAFLPSVHLHDIL
ncbi:hypothetical protein HPB50_001455 [Hyalomma asiaticum]|uniref:Uncharacterized protein n=1 Tax=Hyalomma asiaticum TaxID=266040 RepID=A0ACB7RGS5_HYAAI|nr:hypothetical protein HPB50_001455 [Hyalomma asiaticum]